MQALVEDTKRRMLNTSESVPAVVRREIIDKWGQKMLNSGHSLEEVRRNLISGLKGYERMKTKALKLNKPLHRSAKESAHVRRLKKLTGKSDWFRKVRSESLDDGEEHPSTSPPHHQHQGGDRGRQEAPQHPRGQPRADTVTQLRVTSVLFVEHTRGGALAGQLRTTLKRLEPMLNFRIKVVENAGKRVKECW